MTSSGPSFGDDFGPESDIDLLATFDRDAAWGWRDYLQMENELKDLLRRDVDLVRRDLVEASPNYIRREHILRSARPVYVA